MRGLRYRRDLNRDGVAFVSNEPNLLKWARWCETADRTVHQERLWNGMFVSTVFLGLDHQFGQGPPLLYETMTFRRTAYLEWGREGLDQVRYSTETEAVLGHVFIANRERWRLRPLWWWWRFIVDRWAFRTEDPLPAFPRLRLTESA